MRVLVTGARGVLGVPASGRLRAAGFEVVPVGRAQADIGDATAVRRLRATIGLVDAVVHLAAFVPRRANSDVPLRALRDNVLGTAHVLEAWPEASTVILASTIEVYAPQESVPISEGAKTAPVTAYGLSKLVAERVARALRIRHGMPLAVLRLASVYGVPDPIDRAVPNFVRAAVAGRPLEVFGGGELRDYVHIADVAESIILALSRRADGIYNIGSGVGVTVADAARLVVERAGSASAIVVRERQRPHFDLVLDISAAARDLGYRPRIFPEGIERQILDAR